jgi:ABC-type amino acid transport system permease subunit
MRITRSEQRWASCIFDTIFPSGAVGALPVGTSGVPMRRFLDSLAAHAPVDAVLGLRAATFIIFWFGALFIGRVGAFARLDVAQRVAVLERMAHHPIYLVRELPMLMKTIGAMGYGGVPLIQQQVGVTRVDASPPAWADPARTEQ